MLSDGDRLPNPLTASYCPFTACMLITDSDLFTCFYAVHNTKYRATHPLEDCVTPVWVGHGRWAMVDLTARRTDWGPALGGDGIVTHLTLPDVHHSFAEATEKKRSKLGDGDAVWGRGVWLATMTGFTG